MLISHYLKKIASILLLGILLFNLGGYRLLSDFFEDRADNHLQALLDRDQYDESELISIKVPASLPYGASTKQFERVDGQIEINGVNYTYVKRRFYQDSLELLCIPNLAKNSIQNAKQEFARLANDFINNNSSKKSSAHHTHTAKYSVQDFTDTHAFFSWQFRNAGETVNRYGAFAADVKSAYLSRLDKPPQA